MCGDYKTLNDVTVKDKCPLPRIEDLFDQVRDARVFSKIELWSRYHQMKIWLSDIPKTAFSTRYGLYEFTVISFVLTNAPAYLMDLKNKVPMIWRDSSWFHWRYFCFKSDSDHEKYLRLVLQKLRDNQLYTKYNKCEFWIDKVPFLGHIISSGGMQWIPLKSRR